MARVRAHQHGRALRLRPAADRALSHPPVGADDGRRILGPAVHHAIELRRRLRRAHAQDSDHDGRVRPGERSLGRGRARKARRRAAPARTRHRRHDGQVLARQGRNRPRDDRLLDRARPPLGGVSDHDGRVDLVEIGQGGGSIAWVDDFGKLRVGPRSAGALPGPAAYGRGGTAATTTDANLALGRINPEYFVGGEIVADMDAVDRALDEVASRLGVSKLEAARGIVRIADHNMVNALKLVSVNRGHDPRDFALVAFGGGGGMHATALAAELGIKKVIVPYAADVFAAWGMLMSDLRRDLFLTRIARFEPDSATSIGEAIHDTEQTALSAVRRGRRECRHGDVHQLREAPVRESGTLRRGPAPAGRIRRRRDRSDDRALP